MGSGFYIGGKELSNIDSPNVWNSSTNLGSKTLNGLLNSNITTTWIFGQWFFWIMLLIIAAILYEVFMWLRRSEAYVNG